MNHLLVASPLRKTEKHTSSGYEFSSPRGSGYSTKNEVMLATLDRLEAIWPHGEPFPVLLENTIRNIDTSLRRIAEENLAPNILKMAAHSLVDLRTCRPALAEQLSPRPVATPLARLQSKRGSRLTTMLHSETDISDERVRWLIQQLDGSRDHTALAHHFLKHYPDVGRKKAEEHVGTMLRALHRIGVLVE